MKRYNKRTHEIANRLFKNHWKSKFNILEIEKGEESVTKKASMLTET